MTAVQRALARMRQARSVDAGDDAADELARAARANLPEVIELLRTSRADTVALVWCLQGLTSKAVLDVLLEASGSPSTVTRERSRRSNSSSRCRA